jgi:hypothetical protein
MTSLSFTDDRGADEMWAFVIGARDCGGGSYDSGDAAQMGMRDPAINASPSARP